MSELDDAIARLERAVARLEAAPGLDRPSGEAPSVENPDLLAAVARLEGERVAEGERVRELTAAIATRIDAALDRIGQVLGEDG